MWEALMNLDGNILLWIQEYLRNDALTPIVTFITHLGEDGWIWILLTLAMLFSKKTRKVGAMSAVALIIMLLFNNMFLKNLVARTRPYDVIPGLIPLVPKLSSFSFPSGHTSSAFSAGSVMFRKLPKKFGVPILIFAIIMGLTRLYVGVHYPTDVLFGALEGIVIGFAAEAIVNGVIKLFQKKRSSKERI